MNIHLVTPVPRITAPESRMHANTHTNRAEALNNIF